ncbi:ribosomal protein L4/L1 family [Actinidia rufa]|uniref:Ribosomal protein L4/L1 family n=1 Tax=Actinidia rufa TaxID=165716 RepID=A0A7J0DUN4_9ERIC|nr:ribosomal protein L4/L1 family [Actinidia rufa]
MAAAARPLVTVHNLDSDMATDGATTALALPSVMKAPIRPDIVNHTHANMAKNRRQPYAVSKKTGHQTSAESSWGAFGNMCRGGRMFAPTKIWRRWHNKITVNLKIYAIASAIAASAVPSIVMARGHRIDSVPEIPLVVSDSAEGIEKTSTAIKALKQIGAYPDAEKAKDSHAIRPGKGKMRNRRNVPGVEVINVERLNLLKLAPGGHLGRFVVWTKSAFEKLDSIYGSFDKPSEKKKGYLLPRAKMVNADVPRIINSDELNPYAKTARRMALLAEEQRVKAKKEKLDKKRKQISKEAATTIKPSGKVWYQTMISDSNYTEFENFTKWLGVSQ